MKTENYKGYTINIHQDLDSESPDKWCNEDAFLVYEHRDFTVKREGFNPRDIFDSREEELLYDGYRSFTVNAYIHSGVSLSLRRDQYPFTDRWDVSTTGFVMVKYKKGKHDKYYYKIAESIIEEWNTYLSGNVYGYEINGDNFDDSCWGFYGEKACLEEAKSIIDNHLKRKQKT